MSTRRRQNAAPRGAEQESEAPAARAGIGNAARTARSGSLDGIGTPGRLPFREDLEAMFGVSLGGVRAYLNVGDRLDAIGAAAVASEDAVAFADASPDREQVAEEVAHLLQRQHGGGGGGDGVSDPSDDAEREAKTEARGAVNGRAAQIGKRASAAWMRDPNDQIQEAQRRAAAIKDALLDRFWEQEERALDQLRGQSALMVREIRARFQALTGRALEDVLRERCSEAQYNEGLRLMWRSLTLADRIRSQVDPGWLWDGANEQGILDVIRSASEADRAAAGADASVMALLRSHLSAGELFEARGLLQPGQRYDAVVERIRGAAGWFNDDEDAVFAAISALTPDERARLWSEQQAAFGFLSAAERERVRRACLGTEADGVAARMEQATTGLGTDDGGVQATAQRTGQLVQEEQQLRAELAAPQTTPERRTEIERRLAEIGGVTALVSGPGAEQGAFLQNLQGDVGGAEAAGLAEQMGADPFLVARGRILSAVGWINDDEDAIAEAFAAITDPAIRQRVWDDPQVQRALQSLNEEERATAARFRDGDAFGMAVARLGSAWHQMNADEAKIFSLVAAMSAEDRTRFQSTELFATIRDGLTAAERSAFLAVVTTGRVPTEAGLDAAMGGNWDGTNEDLLTATLRDLPENERLRLRMGYWLDREGKTPADDAQREALAAWRSLHARLASELGTDQLQATIDATLGVPTDAELQSEEGRLMAASILRARVQERMGTQGGLGSAFTETDETAAAMQVQFDAAWAEVMADGVVSAEELAVLGHLEQRFGERHQEAVAASDRIASIAGTVAAVAAGVVVTVLSGGAAGPAVAALITQYGGAAVVSGVAGLAAKVGTAELMGGDHQDTLGADGAYNAVTGLTDGVLTAVASGLGSRFTGMIGLGGRRLASQMTVGALETSGGVITGAGRQAALGGLRNGVEGMLAGAIGEVVFTAADEATWRRSVWDVVCQFGGAVLRGGGLGLVAGGVVGGALEGLSMYVARSRVAGLVADLEAAGLPTSQLDTLSQGAIARLGQVDAALASNNLAEADRLFTLLASEIDPAKLRLLRARLTQTHLGSAEVHAQGLTSVEGAVDLLAADFRATAADLAGFRVLSARADIAGELSSRLGTGARFDDWYAAIVTKVGPDHPAVAALTPEELVAVYGYTTGLYEQLNPAMRSLTDPELADLLPFLRAATSGLNKMPALSGEFTRRMRSLPAAVDAMLQPGEVFSDRAFYSSSLRDDLTHFGDAYVITIRGQSGRYVDDFTAYPGEAEALFPPGVRFKVVSRVQEGGTTRIVLEELP